MSKRKAVNIFKYIFTSLSRFLRIAIRRSKDSLLRLMARRNRPELSRAGFVLPTVTMVLLVVVLLSIAITLRSFNRLETARVSKVNQATLAAAAPALDRASAKLDRLFETKFQATPKDTFLYSLLENNFYNFGDERRLTIAFDVDGSGDILEEEENDTLELEDDEETRTAWMFPVDTDNDSKYDSYSIYSILFRNPSRYEEGNNLGEFNRSRNPLEARTPPMLPAGSETNEVCQAAKGTSSSIVGDSDWFKSDGELKKSFFIYTATVPITLNQAKDLGDNYEAGATGFSALEYQQDRERTPANNNAVWFEDDLELSNVSNFRVNGRIVTNGNLMPRSGFSGPVVFYQVSDRRSCFYEADKSKILVGGHVATGDLRFDDDDDSRAAEVHRFREGNDPAGIDQPGEGINGTNKTTTQTGGANVANNIRAYNARIGNMVDAAMEQHDTNAGWTAPDPRPVPDENCNTCTGLPEGVITDYIDRANGVGSREVLIDVLETYYKDRTRKVPFADNTSNDLPAGFTSDYEPTDDWNIITNNGLTIKT
ncbi:MAG: hormogonium polysaccharide biosynthesis protein HpsA, partial [Microcoleaceae cyanobacterium]